MDNLLFIDILGWIGNVGFIVGCIYLAAKKPIPAQVWNTFGNFMYIFFAWLVCTPSLVVLSIVLIFINLYGIYTWKKEHKANV